MRPRVLTESIDDIVGVLYAKDLLKHWGTSEAESLTLPRIARKPFFVPDTKKISQHRATAKPTSRWSKAWTAALGRSWPHLTN